MGTRALVLFAHGARAASWATPFERLRDLTAARLPQVPVSLAFLELMEPRLPAEVAQLASGGVDDITVVPVFLGQGGHLLRDLPLLVAQLKIDHPGVAIKVVGAVGEDPAVLDAMTAYCVASLT
ncbi:sirohydrochlorin chelatase [Massilia psychrophila]|uniref:Cobalamin biosynthesis protein CbiX n=1 Tax=Massilia psychrophila TaxID=1603353 RepID=A0A2G8T5B4_9BURK|nr:CbiX/SirB N-terminal domain-containing protein [Massilia psychrophila]PIL41236.1 cobalamin biosynthesis protein CbiX [Massilia psychrophila]GGE67743.1 cobalamin biosynthesis protein CbiX [Massilia psychrophila]